MSAESYLNTTADSLVPPSDWGRYSRVRNVFICAAVYMIKRKIDVLSIRYLRVRFTIRIELVLFSYHVVPSGKAIILVLPFLGKKKRLARPN